MSARRLRLALDIVSDIGSLGFDLQHHSDEQIAEAVRILRTVNPEMFDWIVKQLAVQASSPTPDEQEGHIQCPFCRRWTNHTQEARCGWCQATLIRPEASPPTPMEKLRGALRHEDETDEQFEAAVQAIRAPPIPPCICDPAARVYCALHYIPSFGAGTADVSLPTPEATYQSCYSGDVSAPFWRWVKTLPDRQQNRAYSLGCRIQELESKIANLMLASCLSDTGETP